MAEDPRPEFDRDWPVCVEVGCWGVRPEGRSQCLAHSRDFSGLTAGAGLDFRGAELDSTLLAAALRNFTVANKRERLVGVLRCDYAWVRENFYIDYLDIEEGSFSNAWFTGHVEISGINCRRSLNLANATFGGDATLVMYDLGMLNMSRTRFMQRLDLSTGSGFFCPDVRFDGAVNIELHSSKLYAPRVSFGSPSMITGAEITSLAGADASNLVLAGVDLSECVFTGAHRLEQLRIEGYAQFAVPAGRLRTSRRMLADETADGTGDSPERVAALYRSLRKSFEDSKNEAGAGDFYYGEMEARRRSKESSLAERAILSVYWLFSGYGQRASRALAALAVVVAVVTGVLVNTGQDFGLAARIALGTVLSKDPATDLTATGEWTVLVARFLGPVLLALALLAIRSRVKR